ncbi:MULTISPECIES: serpin family protein [Actinosynnema]|uniref:serpin family protein n=1 Tax=Actinosynnema TaxID=40566 RepID=UPI0020A4EA33|nr:serpin family protein [Actinosynnema pretiosum]MCP2093050.1 serpin B [Actinosynnema pretiosum]
MRDRGHLTFALALHDALAPDRARPACWSPYSVASALALLAEAGRGPTRDEVLALLGPGGPELVRESGVGEPAEFAVANTLWAADDLPLVDGFLRRLADWPGGAARSAPFAADPDAARALINADVAQTTRDLVPQLLRSGSVRADTVSVLVNALYLKTAWVTAFPEGATADRPFHTPSGTRPVPTMRVTANARHAARAGWQAVALPAEGGVELVVLLPDGELGALDGVPEVLDGLEHRRVDLSLPRARLEFSALLGGALRGLGVRSVFGGDADLTALSPDPRLVVGEVVHEAVLRVDERGLEGAAATAVLMRSAAFRPAQEPLVVRVDRPHLLLVRHARTGAVFFLAQVVSP